MPNKLESNFYSFVEFKKKKTQTPQYTELAVTREEVGGGVGMGELKGLKVH